ncbi:cytochrome b/b6 domain-containing protein [Methyloterricola oryzae]|uniref:cytochrome b/b6 domain-containing protein n=1 Tax=Methyloterricola oryzae TaxID=1495050 RepID=UPI0005EAECCD|nr:cytochrome b/b6 domain-containing protein [Methyloterricola oryzae]
MNTVIVWDFPTRIFHWSLVASFTGLFITGDSERWRDLHVLLGYMVAGLLCFRIAWGFLGSRYARFGDFLKGPAAIKEYLKSLLSGRPQRHLGHNPAGALAIILLIGLGLISSLTGWLVYEELGPEWLEEVHEVAANAMLAVVIVHVLGVLASSWIHQENLIKAMITGRKPGEAGNGIGRTYPIVGALLIAAMAALWTWAPVDQIGPGGLLQGSMSDQVDSGDDDDD